jgi:hypothetical protein
VSLRRLRSGELLAGAGAIALLVLLSLRWFEPAARRRVVESAGELLGAEARTSGWASLGWPVVAVLLAAVGCGLALVVLTAAARDVAAPVAAGVLTAAVATLALLVLAARVLLFKPGLGLALPNDLVRTELAAYLGLAACALLAAGGWRALADERTSASESAYAPPPPRPPPPPAEEAS